MGVCVCVVVSINGVAGGVMHCGDHVYVLLWSCVRVVVVIIQLGGGGLEVSIVELLWHTYCGCP